MNLFIKPFIYSIFFQYRDYVNQNAQSVYKPSNDVDDDDNPTVSKKDIENEAKEVNY